MLTAHGGKRSFRAKAKATLKGLTIDTKVAQDSYKAENPSIAVRGSPNNKSAMSTDRENKKGLRGKREMRGLAVNTGLSPISHKAENTGVAIDNWIARKASQFEMPRLSEAMMNGNWRNHGRHLDKDSSDTMDPPWTAPPEQSKFPEDVRVKAQRDDVYEIVDYDRGLERAAYRSMRPEDVKPELIPFTTADCVDPDLCLSAPATKTEFCEAEIGTEERSAKYNPSIFQPSVKSVVRLNEMAPTKRAGYEKILNWDEQNGGLAGNQGRRLRDSSSITVISLADPSSSWENVEFPYAEIRAVQGGKRFETGLSGVEETIRNQLSALVEPQSAGLPPAYLRKEYEEIRRERREAMALAKSTIETRGGGNGTPPQKAELGAQGNNGTEFNALLGKLNKLCAPRLRAFTVDEKDDASSRDNTRENENIASCNLQRSLSGDSGISGLSSGSRGRSSTLNPEAVEFHFSSTEKTSPATDEHDSTPDQGSKQAAEPVDPIRQLETRVAELEAQIARQEAKKGQFVRQKGAKGAKGYKTNQAPYAPMVHGGGAHHPAMNGGFQSPPGYQAQPCFPMGAGAMYPSPVPVPGQPVVPQNGLVSPSNGMSANLIGQFNTAPALTPLQAPVVPVLNKPALGTPLWVKSVFGPKPVSKPDRPFRPGDGIQATRQQEYEEYLEHLRATDPNYALRCKQRQARRADRNRSGQQCSGGPGRRVAG